MRVSQGFSKNGVRVSVTVDAAMHIDIPAIGVSVTFHGEVFQVQLSYSHFSHNTEGQCGEWGCDRKSREHERLLSTGLLLPPSPACAPTAHPWQPCGASCLPHPHRPDKDPIPLPPAPGRAATPPQ